MHEIRGFLSYSSLNDTKRAVTKFRQTLETELAQAVGVRVPIFQDHESLKASQNWEERIFEEIDRSDFMVCMVTQGFLISDMCAREFNHAARRGIKIFPVYWYKSRFFEDPQKNLAGLEAGLARQYGTLVRDIKRLQYADFRKLRTKSPSSGGYIQEVAALAETIDAAFAPG